jgi:hypothetical protein
MLRIKFLVVQVLTVCALAPFAFSVTRIGSIALSEPPAGTTSFEKFGALYFPFTFNMPPTLFVLCETGVVTGGGCVNNVISDFVCVANNQFGEGVVAMMSDQGTSLSLGNIPLDFPCQASSSVLVYLTETGKMQTLSPKAGFPTTLGGVPGPFIKVIAQSDLETTSATSDVLSVFSL